MAIQEKKTIEETNKLLILVLILTALFSCTLNKGPALWVCTKPPIAYSWQWPQASDLNGSLCLWHDLRKTEACPRRIRTVSFGAPLTKSWKLRPQMGYTFKTGGPSVYVPCCSCNKWENTATAAASGHKQSDNTLREGEIHLVVVKGDCGSYLPKGYPEAECMPRCRKGLPGPQDWTSM